ncbi:MAG: hypothetical protein KY455_03790 [Euryarchaeota archaeon]|nr:hypothetical protein [Euryarchaeota archaeon]
MGPVRPWLFVMTVLLAFFVLPAPTSAQDEDPPFAHIQGIERGDFWTFRVSGKAKGEVHNEVASMEVHKGADGRSYDTYRIHAFSDLLVQQEVGTGTASTSTEVQERIDVDKWVRVDDYATLEVFGTTTVKPHGQDATTQEIQRTYEPPLVEDIYPYTVGYAWESEVHLRQRNGDQSWEVKNALHMVSVVGYEKVTVPAGTFDAWKMVVRFSAEGASYERWYSEKACTTVKEIRYSRDIGKDGTREKGEPEATLELTDHSCSRSAKEDPVYSTDEVTLTRVPPGMTGPATSPTFEQRDDEEREGVGVGVWLALGVVIGVSVSLIGYGRRRR